MKARILVLIVCFALAAVAAMAHGGEEHVLGTVTKVTDKSITVKTTAKEPVTVNVAAATKFMKGKASAKITDLNVGDRVVIHATEGADEKLVADTVEFAAAAKPAQPRPAAAQQPKTQTLTGIVSDSACGATHTMANMSAADCTRMCAKQGGYVLVVGHDVYTLQGHAADLDKLAAQTVTVTGAVSGKTVTVQSVTPVKKAA
jgi:hypothetical protein